MADNAEPWLLPG